MFLQHLLVFHMSQLYMLEFNDTWTHGETREQSTHQAFKLTSKQNLDMTEGFSLPPLCGTTSVGPEFKTNTSESHTSRRPLCFITWHDYITVPSGRSVYQPHSTAPLACNDIYNKHASVAFIALHWELANHNRTGTNISTFIYRQVRTHLQQSYN